MLSYPDEIPAAVIAPNFAAYLLQSAIAFAAWPERLGSRRWRHLRRKHISRS